MRATRGEDWPVLPVSNWLLHTRPCCVVGGIGGKRKTWPEKNNLKSRNPEFVCAGGRVFYCWLLFYKSVETQIGKRVRYAYTTNKTGSVRSGLVWQCIVTSSTPVLTTNSPGLPTAPPKQLRLITCQTSIKPNWMCVICYAVQCDVWQF